MIEQPVLETPRLRMRPLERSDTSAIQHAASARKIADTMISLPHPYPAGEAERYVAKQQAEVGSVAWSKCVILTASIRRGS